MTAVTTTSRSVRAANSELASPGMKRLLLAVGAVLAVLVGSCSPGADGSWLKATIPDNPTIDSHSGAWVAELAAGDHVADSNEFGMYVFDGDFGGAPRRTVNCTASWCNGTSRDGMSVPLPPGFGWSPGSDHAAAIWDTGAGLVYGFWDISSVTATTITAQDVSRSPDNGNLNGVTTTGSGLEPRAGVLTGADLDAGRADPALVFSSGAGNCGSAFRWPATKTDANQFGPCASNPIPEGTKIRLRRSVNVDALAVPAWQKVALHAMQDYGWVFMDHGGGSNNGLFLRLSPDTGVADYAGLNVPWGSVDALANCAC